MNDPADDSLTEDIWASPTTTTTTTVRVPDPTERPKTPKTPKTPRTPKTPAVHADTTYDRDAALRKELEGVRGINKAIEGIISTLERSRVNMNTVSGTVTNASALLNTWTRILSQTEHNQRLILNPNWKGSTQDMLDMEAEAIQKQQAAERKALEDRRRRDDAKRRAEEEEQRRLAGSAAQPARGTRGTTRGLRARGRGVGVGAGRGVSSRPGSAVGRAQAGDSSTTGSGVGSSSSSTRGGSKIGRGVATSRYGRVRGARGT